MIEDLGTSVVEPAKALAEERSKRDIRGITALVRASLEDEKQMLADPSTVKGALGDLQRATERLEHLRGPGAKWSVVVGDRVADLSNDVSYQFRSGMRTISRVMDELVEGIKSGKEWDNMVRQMQAQVADEVTRVFVGIEEGRGNIRAEVATLLQDEHLSLPTPRGRHDDAVDVGELWQGKALDDGGGGRKAKLTSGLTGLRGAQGGVVMFGMMGQFLPDGRGDDRRLEPRAPRSRCALRRPPDVRRPQAEGCGTAAVGAPAGPSVHGRRAVRGHQRDDAVAARPATRSARRVRRTARRTATHVHGHGATRPEDREPDPGAVEEAVSGDRGGQRSTHEGGCAGRLEPERRTEPRGAVMALPIGNAGAMVQAITKELAHKLDGTPYRADIDAIGARLNGPLQVAIAGHVKAGKSTLLNALVGERLAPTDAGECTRLVSWYRRGPRYEVLARLRNGQEKALEFRSGRRRAPCRAERHARERRAVPRRPLARFRAGTRDLIDTPGLASLNDENSRRTREFLDHDGDHAPDADAVIYLMRHLHRSDVEFLDAFMDRTVAAASPVNAVAVLSRADEIGAGRLDAMESAVRIAERYRDDPAVRSLCATVVPMAGLLAETGLTLREDEASRAPGDGRDAR